jgi:hypothetical protein
MSRDLTHARHRWLQAEAAGDDDAADAAFAELAGRALPQPLASPAFTGATLARVAAAARADAVRARRVRRGLTWGGAVAAVVLLYFGSGILVSALSAALVGSLNLIVAIVVWFAEGGTSRSGLWSILSNLGRAVGAFVAEPRVTFALLGFQAVAAAALVILHRVLGADREWLE